MIYITDTTALDDHEITERFVRAAGPGNQNANRDATAVELRFDIPHSSLPLDVKARLIAIAGRHVTADGVLTVVSRVDRSQARNRDLARGRLLMLLKRASTPRAPRTATTIGPATRRLRLVSKERRSAVKRARSGRDDD